jgi:hypothetical protein
VLLKEPKGRDVGEDDVFSINTDFKNKSIKVKLSAVSSQKEGEVEHMETRQKVVPCCLLFDPWARGITCMWGRWSTRRRGNRGGGTAPQGAFCLLPKAMPM